MKKIITIFLVLLTVSYISCKKKDSRNKVDLNQIDIDQSNDYKHIFKEQIEKEKRLEKKSRKDEFK